MKILILNGSPRPDGNTAARSEAFAKGARENGHFTGIVNVGNMDITGCTGCMYCKGENKGLCVRKDDMQKLYPLLREADMVVFASPVYYFGFTGQMQSMITRLYSMAKPAATKYALILSSASEDVADGIVYQYTSMVNYFGGENLGIRKIHGRNQTEKAVLECMEEFGRSIK